jgi:hypothetical protein
MAGPPKPLDEKSVQNILARAVEIENQQRGALTELEVREIARDLSIPERAIEQALAEHRDVARATVVQSPGLPRWRPRAALVLLAGVGLITITLFILFMVVRSAVPPH